MIFEDRDDAGRQLAAALAEYTQRPGLLVLGIPRGGMVVAAAIAGALGAELDLVVPRKLGAPSNPELAIGAVTPEGGAVLDERALGLLQVDEKYLRQAIARERQEAERRRKLYRAGRPALVLEGRLVIVADDGLATGYTARAALQSLREGGVGELILAVPVGPPDTVARLEPLVDRLVVLFEPPSFAAVGEFYRQFGQTSDEEVLALLRENGPA